MPQNNPAYMLAHSVYGYAKCENSCAFAKTKPQSIITTALQEVKKWAYLSPQLYTTVSQLI